MVFTKNQNDCSTGEYTFKTRGRTKTAVPNLTTTEDQVIKVGLSKTFLKKLTMLTKVIVLF
jgi:hypothetical protein